MNRMWWIPIVGALVTACSSGDSGEEPTAKTPAAEAPAETVFDPMVGTIDRAKSVDAISAGRMYELNQQLGESE